jgi:type IV pilus assembly protein PilC
MTFEEWVIAHTRVASKPHKKVALDDKMTFFQQFSTLICSGTPMLQALRICTEQNQSTRLRQIIDEMANRVAAGSSLHAAAAQFPNVFEHHWVEVIRTGELTGKMGPVLLELNKQIRESRETRRKVTGALMYPIILVVVAVTAVTVMLWLVVPTFANMFKEMGATLPGMTQFVVDASEFIVKYGLYLLGAVIAVAVAFRQYMKTEDGRRRVKGVGMATPLVGELMVQSAMYSFASNISLLLKSGIPMLDTIETLRGVFHLNPHYRDALTRAQGRVAAGRSLAGSLEETRLFTTMITNMVRIGEESGQLATVMEQIAPYYKEKMEALIAKLTKLMEPVIIMGMGTTIAGMMLAIYLPMFEMAGKVH